MDKHPHSEEELLAHAAWVQGVVRAMVRDEHLAEDLVQDALEAGLRTGPERIRNPRSWLLGVVRNLHRQDARAGTRRRATEARKPAPGDPPTSEELLARLEVQQLVAKAVMDLPDPFRSVLILRYYEGAPVRRIAAARDVDRRKVETQLRRGHELLRKGLKAKLGKAWVVAVLPLGFGALTPAAAATTAIATARWGRVAAGLLALMGFVVVFVSGPWKAEGPRVHVGGVAGMDKDDSSAVVEPEAITRTEVPVPTDDSGLAPTSSSDGERAEVVTVLDEHSNRVSYPVLVSLERPEFWVGDAEGRVEVPKYASIRHERFLAFARGYAARTLYMGVEPAFSIESDSAILGRVVDRDTGAGIPGVRVRPYLDHYGGLGNAFRVFSDPDLDHPGLAGIITSTGPDGRFEVHHATRFNISKFEFEFPDSSVVVLGIENAGARLVNGGVWEFPVSRELPSGTVVRFIDKASQQPLAHRPVRMTHRDWDENMQTDDDGRATVGRTRASGSTSEHWLTIELADGSNWVSRIRAAELAAVGSERTVLVDARPIDLRIEGDPTGYEVGTFAIPDEAEPSRSWPWDDSPENWVRLGSEREFELPPGPRAGQVRLRLRHKKSGIQTSVATTQPGAGVPLDALPLGTVRTAAFRGSEPVELAWRFYPQGALRNVSSGFATAFGADVTTRLPYGTYQISGLLADAVVYEGMVRVDGTEVSLRADLPEASGVHSVSVRGSRTGPLPLVTVEVVDEIGRPVASGTTDLAGVATVYSSGESSRRLRVHWPVGAINPAMDGVTWKLDFPWTDPTADSELVVPEARLDLGVVGVTGEVEFDLWQRVAFGDDRHHPAPLRMSGDLTLTLPLGVGYLRARGAVSKEPLAEYEVFKDGIARCSVDLSRYARVAVARAYDGEVMAWGSVSIGVIEEDRVIPYASKEFSRFSVEPYLLLAPRGVPCRLTVTGYVACESDGGEKSYSFDVTPGSSLDRLVRVRPSVVDGGVVFGHFLED